MSVDDEEDSLPSDFDDVSTKSRSIPNSPAATPTSPFVKGKRTDCAMYYMSTLLASVAMGFDIGIANTRAIHPNLHSPSAEEDRSMKKRDSYINNRRDAYLAAVRDSFIEPEGDFRAYQSPPPGYWHTYHGVQHRQRPGIPLDTDIQSPVMTDSDFNNQAAGGGYGDDSVHTASHRLSYTDSEASGLSGTTPSTERTVVYNCQLSSEVTIDLPAKPTNLDPGNKSQRRSVTFEDDFIPPDYSKANSNSTFDCHRRTPSNTSNSSATFDHQDSNYVSTDYFLAPHPDYNSTTPQLQQQQPVPPRRRSGAEPAQRPTTLDVGGATRAMPLQIKHSVSPGYVINPARGKGSGEDYLQSYSNRSHMSPGSTPPHISHQKTLLDIDVEGQNQDATRPLVHHSMGTKFSVADLEKEFLS